MTVRRFLPGWIRDKGISSQRELVLALLPYLEWRSNQDLKHAFEIIMPHTEPMNMDGNKFLGDIISKLRRQGIVETRYSGTVPETCQKHMKPYPYVEHRRVVKRVPKTHIADALLSGQYGLKKYKKVTPRKKQKTSVKKLTIDDLRYIQTNHLDMSGPQLAEMFNVTQAMIYKIRKGHVPAHLRP